MGASYLARNVAALATEGRLVVIGLQGGTKAELDLNALMRKRGAVDRDHAARAAGRGEGRDLRARSSSTSGRWWPTGRSARSSTRTIPLADAAGAHAPDGERRRTPARSCSSPDVPGWRRFVGHEPERDALSRADEHESGQQHVIVVGPDGQPVAVPGRRGRSRPRHGDERRRRPSELTDLVEQPAKVMRIGSMIRQLLEEVKSAPLDEASRNRLKEIHRASIKELESGLAPELVEELERLSLPFTEDADAVRRRAPDRPGPARRLARGALPRHPDRDLRPADLGRARSSSRCAARCPGGPASRAGSRPGMPPAPQDPNADPGNPASGMYL